jgi:hypothetical protein
VEDAIVIREVNRGPYPHGQHVGAECQVPLIENNAASWPARRQVGTVQPDYGVCQRPAAKVCRAAQLGPRCLRGSGDKGDYRGLENQEQPDGSHKTSY